MIMVFQTFFGKYQPEKLDKNRMKRPSAFCFRQ